MILIHGFIMTAGLAFALGGIACALFSRRKAWWLTAHRRAGYGTAGALCLGGLLAIVALSLSGEGHLGTPHALIGSAGIALGLVTPALGTLQFRDRRLQPFHRWSGRITGTIMLVNVILGLVLVGIL